MGCCYCFQMWPLLHMHINAFVIMLKIIWIIKCILIIYFIIPHVVSLFLLHSVCWLCGVVVVVPRPSCMRSSLFVAAGGGAGLLATRRFAEAATGTQWQMARLRAPWAQEEEEESGVHSPACPPARCARPPAAAPDRLALPVSTVSALPVTRHPAACA